MAVDTLDKCGVYFGTTGGQVYASADAGDTWTQYKPGENRVRLPSTDVQTIAVAPDGGLWFGLSYAGAAHFDGSTWQAFSAADGLIHPNVTDIYVHESGEVWFATSGGISRYRP